jgi:uncharacterized membrane protein YeaQ/YmgE (transglycosylase-associated protein family)
MGIIWTVIIGFVAGLLARALKPGDDKLGFFWTIALGIGGSFLAKYIGLALGWYREGDPIGFVASVLGAIVLLVIYGAIKKRS